LADRRSVHTTLQRLACPLRRGCNVHTTLQWFAEHLSTSGNAYAALQRLAGRAAAARMPHNRITEPGPDRPVRRERPGRPFSCRNIRRKSTGGCPGAEQLANSGRFGQAHKVLGAVEYYGQIASGSWCRKWPRVGLAGGVTYARVSRPDCLRSLLSNPNL